MRSSLVTFGKTYEVIRLSYRDKGLMNLLDEPDAPVVYRKADNDPASRAMLYLAANTIDSFVQHHEDRTLFAHDDDFTASPTITVTEPRFHARDGVLLHTGGRRSRDPVPLYVGIEEGRLVSVRSLDGSIDFTA